MLISHRDYGEMITEEKNLQGAESWVGPLSAFLHAQGNVEAIMFDAERRSVSLATMGGVDMALLERRLQAVLRSLDQEHMVTNRSPGAGMPGGIVLRRLPKDLLLEKPSCLTAPMFWKWREFAWPEPEALVERSKEEWRDLALQAAVCGSALILAVLASKVSTLPAGVSLALFAISLIAGAWDAAIDAVAKLRERELDIHFLMLAVAAGAAAIGAYTEGALLLFLFSASGAMESYALHRTHREINSLTKAAPRTANILLANGSTEVRETGAIEVGDRLVVKPDEVFPVDGEVLTGETASDESNLTGEATPVPKAMGDTVLSGTLNLWGAVTIRTLRCADESALQKIITLIQTSQHLRAPSQRFTDRFGSHYTYGVLGAVLVMFVVWWQGFGIPAFQNSSDTTSAFYRAMTLLVVASPCALVLSIPSAILAAIAWGAKNGILFRGGAAIEKLAEIDTVALDKTGTLTTGNLAVTTVESFPAGREADVLDIAFTLESHSNHPIARAITLHGKRQGLSIRAISDFQSLTGKGLRAQVEDKITYLGRRELLTNSALADFIGSMPEPPLSQTEVWIIHENLIGRILLRDEVREESKSVLAALTALGLRTIMLTGDRRGAAESVARALGLTDVRAGLQPEDKVAAIEELKAQGHKVAMVGDGVNDAPSLAAAYVSIAMGGRGSDAAMEQSDIILMNDRIDRILAAFRLSRAARAVIRQNLIISLGTVLVMVGASLFGIVPLTLGVVAHEGSTLLVCLNSLRLLFLKKT